MLNRNQDIFYFISFPEDDIEDSGALMSVDITPPLTPSSRSLNMTPTAHTPVTPPGFIQNGFGLSTLSPALITSIPSDIVLESLYTHPPESDFTTSFHSYLDNRSTWSDIPVDVGASNSTERHPSKDQDFKYYSPYDTVEAPGTIFPSAAIKVDNASLLKNFSRRPIEEFGSRDFLIEKQGDKSLRPIEMKRVSLGLSQVTDHSSEESRVIDDKFDHKVRTGKKGDNASVDIERPKIKIKKIPSSSPTSKREPSHSLELAPIPTPTVYLTTPNILMDSNLPEGVRAILDLPYRSYEVPRLDYVLIANEVLQAGQIMLDSRSRRRKYRCRYHRKSIPVCDMRSKLLVAPDMMRHMGIHADQERVLVDEGKMDLENAVVLKIFRRNPALYETIDPRFCTCYACDPPEVFQRKDSYERHFRSQHNGTTQQLKEIAAAIRGMHRHRQYRLDEDG